MDVSNKRVPRLVKGQRKSSKGKDGNSLKVVYISSPMKVRTSASKFRSLVQELTGMNSDISHYMEGNDNFEGNDNSFRDIGYGEDDRSTSRKGNGGDKCPVPSLDSSDNTLTSSDSFFDPIENVFTSHVDDQFVQFFNNDCFFESSQVDVLWKLQ